MKPVWRGMAVVVVAVGVAACAKQAWRVMYPGADNYSLGMAVLVADAETSYFSGYLSDDAAFVAAYDRAGKRLWDRVLSGADQFFARDGGRSLVQDSTGLLHVRWQDAETRSNRLFTLDEQGRLLATVELEGSQYLDNLQRFSTDTLYLSSTTAPVVKAYSTKGEMLWAFSPAVASAPGDGDLEDYPDQNAERMVKTTYSTSSGYSALSSTHLLEREGRLYFGYPDGIVELDANGVAVISLAASDLGLSALYETFGTDTGLTVVGEAGGSLVAVLLDAELHERMRTQLVSDGLNGLVVSGSEDAFCIALRESSSERNVMRLMRWDAGTQLQWTQEREMDGATWEYASVLAADSACYLTALVVQEDDRVLTRTERFGVAGTLTDTFNLQDFALSGIVVHGKGIYHAGITGEYDNSATVATLDKQMRQ